MHICHNDRLCLPSAIMLKACKNFIAQCLYRQIYVRMEARGNTATSRIVRKMRSFKLAPNVKNCQRVFKRLKHYFMQKIVQIRSLCFNGVENYTFWGVSVFRSYLIKSLTLKWMTEGSKNINAKRLNLSADTPQVLYDLSEPNTWAYCCTYAVPRSVGFDTPPTARYLTWIIMTDSVEKQYQLSYGLSFMPASTTGDDILKRK